MRHLICLTLALLGTLTGSVQAHPQHTQHAHSSHGESPAAHQHGIGHLDLVLEGSELILALRLPASDLLGFEHAPVSAEQHARLQQVQTILHQPHRLFELPEAAQCSLTSVQVHNDLAAEQTASTPDRHSTGHADISAYYSFSCARPDRLQQLQITLFDHFPGSEKLLLQAITPAGQQGDELSAGRNRIRL